MELTWILLAIGVVALAFGLKLRRGNELFCLRVRKAELKLVRGKAPPRLVADVKDVIKRARVQRAEIRVVVEEARPRVLSDGLNPGTEQQVRNIVGTWKLAQLRAVR